MLFDMNDIIQHTLIIFQSGTYKCALQAMIFSMHEIGMAKAYKKNNYTYME